MTASQSIAQKQTAKQSYPTKKGWVNCFYRTYKGKKLGPYYVRRWKIGKKLYKEYIKPKDVERVKAECQGHRERRKRLSNFLHNVDFLGKMMNRYDEGKIVTPAMQAYICRIYNEGHYITGKPQMRRKVTRHLAEVAGEKMLVRTVFELDGTTKVFMVPFFFNRVKARTWAELIVEKYDRMKTIMLEAWNEVHNPPPHTIDRSTFYGREAATKPNPWLQAAH